MAIVGAQEASLMHWHNYHVFLSFRGEDTRKTFTDHLYTALVGAGYRTFRDDDDIERGKNISSEIEKAIEQSKSSIIVFSKDYASSQWCLDELLMILKHKRTSGHIVLPVFYDVDPSQVRNQTGRIAEAFAIHEERFKAETDERTKKWVDKVDGWREALKEVANLGGMVLQNQFDGYESRFIRKIVKEVQDKVSRTVLSIPRNLIGIDSRVQNVNLWLQDQLPDAQVMVISGMGGIGKTTIAKVAYNLNFENFEGSSFLADIRETSKQHNGLLFLQRKVLSDILKGKKEKIGCVDEGITKIKEAICCKRVLIVLDDVDQAEQLDAVLRMRNRFHPGSKIIITTRHQWLLKPHEVDVMCHRVEKLGKAESFKLFSWHAFGQDHPIEGYKEHSERVVNCCGGLPLALQVLGSSLSGNCIDVWQSALEKLEEIPDSRIIDKLKISYDSIQDDHDQGLFLDIACFFVGKREDYVITVLKGCGFHPKVGIKNLVDRCLLTIDGNKKLMMHQLVRVMGREIVRRESLKELGERSRLWRHNESFDVLKYKNGTKSIEGLALDMRMLNNVKRHHFQESHGESLLPDQGNSPRWRGFNSFPWNLINSASRRSNEVDLKFDAFARMQTLRLLQINYVQLSGCYKEFPKKLRMLCWRGFHLKSIPSDFPLDSLVALDMRNSSLEQVWMGIKLLKLLKILNLSHSHDLIRIPDFIGLPKLERLILKDCPRLGEIHESIGDLKRLVFLNFKDCKNLRMLPRSIGMLMFLETLIISGCSNLDKWPIELSKMESLKVLHMDGTPVYRFHCDIGEGKLWHAFIWSWMLKPTSRPEVLWASLPRSLVSLSLAECSLSDNAFPKDFHSLPLLKNLNLSQNPICSLPESFKDLTRLQTLDLKSCTRLSSLTVPSSLQELDVDNCSSLEKITSVSTSFRPVLGVADSNNQFEVQNNFKLESIRNIDEKALKYLGFFQLNSVENVEVEFYDRIANKVEKLPFQGLYESGVFSTFFPGSRVPSWFGNKTAGSSISFTVPSLLNLRIRGLNLCFVYALSDNQKGQVGDALQTEISNKTKGLRWYYHPKFLGIPETDKNMIWLSHWKVENDQLEIGDELKISLEYVSDVFEVKECGVHLVCEEQEQGKNHSNSNGVIVHTIFMTSK
ncbi:disease resistance protein RPV1-like isoform X2 [Cornus florida]|nr:disease resistance protein RPV1-like isoform X2 [Cornus florida]XP_059648331.1 disease resistance protein RPV1-like isoform X2 [Cornus florida]XP_059648332.1 disease resistance protein RPV1-like isoform X2 [Cornus florida]